MPEWLASIYSPLIVFWAQQVADFDIDEINAAGHISEIDSRPVFIIQGSDRCLDLFSIGNRLYDAAKEPKDICIAIEVETGNFEDYIPEEFERRIVDFFDRYLQKE